MAATRGEDLLRGGGLPARAAAGDGAPQAL